jgi:two-component system sensor histidine kinase BaeS
LGRPLGAIRSAIQALLKGADKDPQLGHDLLNGLDGETGRLQRLLDDLAGSHDQILGRLELNREQIQLDGWIHSALSPWEAAAHDKGLIWNADIPTSLPIILMDADRMAQALGNLVSNAVKFTPAGGTITVTAKSAGAEFVLDVMDTGAGIPLDEQQKIFEPFYRGSHGRRIVQGMGLGLSIAHDIVAAHGGTIKLQSTLGAGSHFTLRMPLS